MFLMGVLFTLLVAVNIAAFWIWIVKRISERGYGSASRQARIAQMMPVSDRTVVVERQDGPDVVRSVSAQPGATAGG